MRIGSRASRLLLCVILFAAQVALAQKMPGAPTLAITAAPSSLSFGNQALNTTSAPKTVTVTNNQTIALTITELTLNLADYTETTTCPISPATLAAGASCTVSISFAPGLTGSRNATLVVLNDTSVTPMVTLTGTGVLPAAVTPTALTFGSAKVGTTSRAQSVVLVNNLSTALTISSINSSLSDFQTTSSCPIRPSMLAAGASCATSVSFRPTTTGTRSATLSFVDNANNSPQTVSLVGTGASGTLVSIAVAPASTSVPLGATQQFIATGTYSDHSTQNVTASANWSSSVSTVATVGAGLATTLAEGTTNIAAVSGTITGKASLTVSAPALLSIALTPANPSIAIGMSQQLTATGTYTNGSTQDLTGTAAWTSTLSKVASVSNSGVVDGLSAGTATIKATVTSVSGSTAVTVVPNNVAYYVSPTGNDSNSGTLQFPLATAQRAEQLVMQNYLGSHCTTQKAPIVVQFLSGGWTNFSLSLTTADSGCSASAPVVFENYPGGTPVFSGGVRVLNWVNKTGSVWQATLPRNTANFEALYYNGVRRLRPRLGSSKDVLGTYYRVAGSVPGDYDRFYYNSKDPIATTWKNYAPTTGNPCGQAAGPPNLQGDIQVGIFEQWDVSWQRISCIDTANHIIYLTGSTAVGVAHGYIANHRYIVENIKDDLATPGQWFLDRSVTGAWVLTYIANAGENPNLDTVMIPQQARVLSAAGVRYRDFYGLTFSNDNFVVSSTGYQGSQSELMVPAAVTCTDCSFVTFDSDSFTNIEGYALAFPTDNNGSATADLIQNNAFWDIGAGALSTGRIPTGGETDSNVFQFATIQNNLMKGFGRKFAGGAGIANLLSHDVSTTHNDITDGYNEGIMLCFPSFSNNCTGNSTSGGSFNHTIDFNHIWNLGQGLLNDFGAIYIATYNATGITVANNKIHDLTDASSQDSDGYGGNGFYIDRGGPITVSNNLVYRTVNAFNITMGPPSTGQMIAASNNIFAYTRKSIINLYACDKAGYSQFSMGNSIFYQDRTSASLPSSNLQNGATYLGNPAGSGQLFLSNDYWNTTEDFATDAKGFNSEPSTCQNKTYYTLAKWQATGQDIGSLSVNPGFTSPAYPNDDFDFLTNPPNIGFVPFSTRGTCPTCPGRTDPVISAPSVPAGFPTVPFNPATDY